MYILLYEMLLLRLNKKIPAENKMIGRDAKGFISNYFDDAVASELTRILKVFFSWLLALFFS